MRLAHQVADLGGGVAHLAGGLALHLRAGDGLDGLADPRGGLFVAHLLQHMAAALMAAMGLIMPVPVLTSARCRHRLETCWCRRARG